MRACEACQRAATTACNRHCNSLGFHGRVSIRGVSPATACNRLQQPRLQRTRRHRRLWHACAGSASLGLICLPYMSALYVSSSASACLCIFSLSRPYMSAVYVCLVCAAPCTGPPTRPCMRQPCCARHLRHPHTRARTHTGRRRCDQRLQPVTVADITVCVVSA